MAHHSAGLRRRRADRRGCGGFLNSLRLKGIHLAMRTGMLAAESAFDAMRAGDLSAARLKRYSDAIDAQ